MARSTQRMARIGARIAPDALAMIECAAALQGRSVSDFVAAAAQDAARKAIGEAHLTRLSLEDQERFAVLLLDPPSPARALERAQVAHGLLIQAEP